jgi:chromosome segregation ATPase
VERQQADYEHLQSELNNRLEQLSTVESSTETFKLEVEQFKRDNDKIKIKLQIAYEQVNNLATENEELRYKKDEDLLSMYALWLDSVWESNLERQKDLFPTNSMDFNKVSIQETNPTKARFFELLQQYPQKSQAEIGRILDSEGFKNDLGKKVCSGTLSKWHLEFKRVKNLGN